MMTILGARMAYAPESAVRLYGTLINAAVFTQRFTPSGFRVSWTPRQEAA